MKKILIIFCIVIVCFLLFSIFTTAHSGRTDSNGGHRDHSTGEYHYHHGYSAHQHYDMDGDGIIDCPYEFKDKTNYSNTPNNNHTSTNNKTEDSKNVYQEQSSELTFGETLLIVLNIIGISLLILVGGCVFWCLAYELLLVPLISLACKKIFKIDANESTISKVSITTIVVIVVTIVSIVVFKSESLL